MRGFYALAGTAASALVDEEASVYDPHAKTPAKDSIMANILACIDFDPNETQAVLSHARRQARAYDAGVVILHVAPPDPDFVGFSVGPQVVRNAQAKELRDEHRKLEAMQREVTEDGIECLALMVPGPTVEKIIEVAGEQQACMIVMATHHHSRLHDMIAGSDSKGVLYDAPCPVLMIPTEQE
jgi:nucleotide-binding universal stress UspA family protein